MKNIEEVKNLPLRKKLIVAICMLVFGCAITFSVTSAIVTYNTTTVRTESFMKETIETAASLTEAKLKECTNLAIQISTNEEIYSTELNIDDKNNYLKSRFEQFGALNVSVINADLISDTEREQINACMGGKVVVSTPEMLDGSYIVNVYAPVWDDGITGTTVNGVLKVVMPQSIINSAAEDYVVEEHSKVIIVDNDGNIIADSSKELINKNVTKLAVSDESFKNLSTAINNIKSGKSTIEKFKFNNDSKVMTYKSIEDFDGYGIISLESFSDYNNGFNASVISSIALLIICMGIAVFCSMWLASRLADPIRLFIGRLKSLADGDVSSPAPDIFVTSEELYDLRESLKKTINTTSDVILDTKYLLGEMANGNFSVKSKNEDKYLGDYRSILDSSYKIRDSLSDTLGQIIVIAEQVTEGSAQVSCGAQGLAQGATEQASAVEELSATVTEVDKNIRDTANEAEQANVLTKSTGSMMQTTIMDMVEAKKAMEEITSTSNSIKKVIKAIDDIAFQTNILALNAAVEAARAGSAGKGFAVVADEVRNLAQKSSESAKNTAMLIENAIIAVGKGSSIVNKANDTFEIVVSKSAEASELINIISQQATEQANAIGQITIGINQISGVVQTNSATSEESAAASEELSAQASVLKSMVEKFNIKR